MNKNLYSQLESRFPSDPSAPCMRLPDGRTITYGDLREQSARYANLLVSLGARPGDRVAAQVNKSPAAVFLYLGCLRAGCAFLPMNPAYQRDEVTYLLSDAEPTVFVCRAEAGEAWRTLGTGAGVPNVVHLSDDGTGELADQAAGQDGDFATIHRNDDDLAALLYTSGTTGRPKGAMLTHRNLASNAAVLHRVWAFESGDVLLHILPIFHTHGLFVALHCAFWNGSAIWFEPKFDPRRVLELLPRSTVCMGVPTHYTRLLAEPELDADVCANMRLFISGSAPLLPDTFKAFRERTGHTILERYGMTEGGMFSSNPYEGERRCGTVGQALPGVSLRVMDDQDRPVPSGTTGHVQVRGENVFAGYWRLPEKTAQEHTDDGYFRTGDLGIMSDDGYLTIVGRDKDLIISGGLNIYPREIEEVIDALPGIGESAVIGVTHADFGEAVTAVVVPDARSVSCPAEDEVIAAVRDRLAGFKVPKSVHFVDALPRNAMGKVQKNVLRDRFGKDTVSAGGGGR